MNSPSPPSARYYNTFAYDSQSNVSILFGGLSGGNKDDTWAYQYQPNVPSEPRDLQAILKNGSVTLTWKSSKTNAGSPITSYLVYRGTTLESLVNYATIQVEDPLEFIDTEVSKGTTYYYAIRAKNAIGESKNSNSVDIKIPAPASGFTLIILSFSLIIHSVIRRKKM